VPLAVSARRCDWGRRRAVPVSILETLTRICLPPELIVPAANGRNRRGAACRSYATWRSTHVYYAMTTRGGSWNSATRAAGRVAADGSPKYKPEPNGKATRSRSTTAVAQLMVTRSRESPATGQLVQSCCAKGASDYCRRHHHAVRRITNRYVCHASPAPWTNVATRKGVGRNPFPCAASERKKRTSASARSRSMLRRVKGQPSTWKMRCSPAWASAPAQPPRRRSEARPRKMRLANHLADPITTRRWPRRSREQAGCGGPRDTTARRFTS